MSETVVIPVPDGTDPDRLIERARVGDPVDPTGFVVIAEAKRHRLSVLEGLAAEIDTHWRGKPTALVGIDYHFGTLRTASEAFDTTLAVAPNREAWVDRLDVHLPALLRYAGRLGDLGSARAFRVPVDGHARTSDAVVRALRSKKGQPLHELAEVTYPSFHAYRAPGPFVDPTERVLSDLGLVIDRQATSQDAIQVTSFVFDVNEAVLAAHADAREMEGGDPPAPEVDGAATAQDGDQPQAPPDAEQSGADRVVYRDLPTDGTDR